MAGESQNLAPARLQAIRKPLDEHGLRQEAHGKVRGSVAREAIRRSMRFEAPEERFEMLRGGATSATGFAAHAGRRHGTMKDQVSAPAKRVEKLEKSK